MSAEVQEPSTSTKPWVCCFCSKSYHRSDVLRRHYIRCSSRGQQPIPERLKKGKKSTACDACARSKLRCDLECPCETCLAHGYECTYVRVSHLPGQQIPLQNASVADYGIDGQLYEPSMIPVSHTQPDQRKISLSFLLNYADPKNTTISEAFYPGLTARGSQDVGEDVPEPASPSLHDIDTFVPLETAALNDLFRRQTLVNHDIDKTAPESEDWLDTWDDTDSPMPGVPWPDVHPCNKLIDSLTQFTLSLPAGHQEKAPNAKLAKSSALFSAQSLERLIGLYFREWGPHTPVIHQATWCPYDTMPHLLLAMMLIAATLSPSTDEACLANNMIDLADDYVFRNPVFQKTIAGCLQSENFTAKEALQALQAVFLMSQIQLRTAPIRKRKEIRKDRFDQIILACRGLRLLESKNSFWHNKDETFHWEEYAASEARIRLICGIFNLDASFTILYNSSPRLFGEEMEVDMPGPLEAFIATSPGEAEQAASESRKSEHLTLATLCDIFMRKDLEVETSVKLKDLTILDLFIVVLALLQFLWLSPYNSTKADTICRVSQALMRWKTAWDHQNSILTAQELERYGFPRMAALEFWQLAMFMVDQGKTRLDDTMLLSNDPGTSEEVSVHAILKNIDRR
ncbi:hypothetical protein EDD37DRAFT_186904 [Exophiala viscosa]|uniref:Zn(2)-C6 fungal-type domain-containing protein n=1 Tax=Exophiala viscosa TaxID=2486360 RepID=A0AAN6DP21_9EURO|nr:hypothetical protein EDD36DRAFT_448926 [Exophiala viscosa]KAI1620116.1 hypothetical protein EDD37DRAFT_186904 [Exophiala viscosa]